MFTGDVFVLVILASVLLAVAVFLLVYGIYSAITDRDLKFCIVMIVCFLYLSGLSGVVFVGAEKEYNNAKTQNQVKILKQKISDAEKELQKFCIDYPEFREAMMFDKEELEFRSAWHYSGAPEHYGDLLCQIAKDEFEVGYYNTGNQKFYTKDGKEIKPIAWCEIIPPQAGE